MLPADCGLYKMSLSILVMIFVSFFFVVQSFLPSSVSSFLYCVYIIYCISMCFFVGMRILI